MFFAGQGCTTDQKSDDGQLKICIGDYESANTSQISIVFSCIKQNNVLLHM